MISFIYIYVYNTCVYLGAEKGYKVFVELLLPKSASNKYNKMLSLQNYYK